MNDVEPEYVGSTEPEGDRVAVGEIFVVADKEDEDVTEGLKETELLLLPEADTEIERLDETVTAGDADDVPLSIALFVRTGVRDTLPVIL